MKQAAVRTTALSMDGAMRVFSGDEQGFSYRTSAFENLDMIIVKTVFRLFAGADGRNCRAHAIAYGKAPRLAAVGASFRRKHVQAPEGATPAR